MSDQKAPKPKVAPKIMYKIEGDKLVRQGKFCPRCGAGIFMAEHVDRFHCGRCSFTEFKKDVQKFRASKSAKPLKEKPKEGKKPEPKKEEPKEEPKEEFKKPEPKKEEPKGKKKKKKKKLAKGKNR